MTRARLGTLAAVALTALALTPAALGMHIIAAPGPAEVPRRASDLEEAWGAILAGSAVAISMSLVLVVLGAGLGFSSISPWPHQGLSAGDIGIAGTIWLIVTQWLSAAVGGYVTGRLRHRWLATHTHEVFFRDTAHGLITWATATLFVAALLWGSASTLIGGGAKAVEGVATSAASVASKSAAPGHEAAGAEGGYDMDKLFRTTTAGDGSARVRDPRAEAALIAARAVTTGALPEDDRTYLVTLVAARSGISTDEAQKRVDAYIQSAKAKAVADEARKAAATASLYAAMSLLIGAFIASVSAALGGRLRDEHL